MLFSAIRHAIWGDDTNFVYAFWVTFVIVFCAEFGFILYFWVKGASGLNLLEKKYNLSKKLAYVNGCSD